MKIILKLLLIVLIIFLILIGIKSCIRISIKLQNAQPYTKEVYNQKDLSDFPDDIMVGGGIKRNATIKFTAIRLKDRIDTETIKQLNLKGESFLFIGSISANEIEKTKTTLYYEGFVKSNRDAIYYAKIPFDKVRIYEDLKPGDEPCIICSNSSVSFINVNDENRWDQYEKFNLHVPKGTIIPKVDLKMDLQSITK